MREGLKVVFRRLKPFKGTSFYEVQLGPLVLQIPITEENQRNMLKYQQRRGAIFFKTLYVWRDPLWLL